MSHQRTAIMQIWAQPVVEPDQNQTKFAPLAASLTSLNHRYELGLLTFTEYTEGAKALQP